MFSISGDLIFTLSEFGLFIIGADDGGNTWLQYKVIILLQLTLPSLLEGKAILFHHV